MPAPVFAHTAAWLLAAAPLLALAGLALLGRAFGEWGRDALVAYAAVLFACLCGASSAALTGSGALAPVLAILGVAFSFVSVVLSGVQGLLVLAFAYAGLLALALARGNDVLPWPLPTIAVVVCAVVAVRYLRG